MFFGRNKSTGEKGEILARRYLKKRGWRIVTKNLWVDKDEIDILALSPKGDYLTLVEVRATENSQRDPRATVDHQKRRCMLRVARKMVGLAAHHRCRLRVDLITVNLGLLPPLIGHFEDQISINEQF